MVSMEIYITKYVETTSKLISSKGFMMVLMPQ